jgi:hypothetical protein
MKRKLLMAVLGFAFAPAVFGQGHILISNYIAPPYNQVYYANVPPTPAAPNGPAVTQTSVILTVWYGEGNITDPSLLVQGVNFAVNPSLVFDPGHGHGPGGYYFSPAVLLPTWQAGDTFTFQVRASGTSPYGPVDTLLSRSVLWTESSAIGNISLPANANTFSAGVPVHIVPEPSSLTMIGLSVASFLVFRRRAQK